MVTHRQVLEKLKKIKEGHLVSLSNEESKVVEIIKNHLRRRLSKEPTIDDIVTWLEEQIRTYGDYEVVFLQSTLVFYPNFELATQYCYIWYKKLLKPELDRSAIGYVELSNEKCTRTCLLTTLSVYPSISYLELNGHGSETVFTGYLYVPVIVYGTVDDLVKQLSGKIASFLSCKVGARLVPWLIENNYLRSARAYDDVFVFVIDRSKSPEEDNTPEWFFRPYFTFAKSMLLAKTMVKEAYELSQKAWNESYQYAPEVCKPYILHDKEHEKVFGDLNAKVTEEFVDLEVKLKVTQTSKLKIISRNMQYEYTLFKGKVPFPKTEISITVPQDAPVGKGVVTFTGVYKDYTGTAEYKVEVVEKEIEKKLIIKADVPKQLVKTATYKIPIEFEVKES